MAGSESLCLDDDADPMAFLGTPSARMWKGAGPAGGPTQVRNSKRGLIEAQVMELLPTTTAMDYKASGGAEGSSNVTLTDAVVRGRGLLPSPHTSDTNGPGHHGTGGPDLRTVAAMLPTPRATRGGSGTETMYLLGAERSDDGRTQGEVLPQTPSVADGMGGHLSRSGARSNELLLPGQAKALATNWGLYEPAIRRWEATLGRPAPSPTEPNAKGNHRLSPKFTEWMMGVPDGWITGVDISRNEQLKACGNGVVPTQAAAALKDMLEAFE